MAASSTGRPLSRSPRDSSQRRYGDCRFPRSEGRDWPLDLTPPDALVAASPQRPILSIQPGGQGPGSATCVAGRPAWSPPVKWVRLSEGILELLTAVSGNVRGRLLDCVHGCGNARGIAHCGCGRVRVRRARGHVGCACGYVSDLRGCAHACAAWSRWLPPLLIVYFCRAPALSDILGPR